VLALYGYYSRCDLRFWVVGGEKKTERRKRKRKKEKKRKRKEKSLRITVLQY
jgi:hypothetical protein